MDGLDITPKFVEVGSGKRIVILDEEEFHRVLDALEAIEARKILSDPSDEELDWQAVSQDFIDNRIAHIRAEKGFTQRKLADRLGVKPSTVSRWEKKDANLTLETLRKVARALECDVHDLIA